MGEDDDDLVSNVSTGRSLEDVIHARLTRRAVLGGSRPRSALLVITKDDGGPIGD